MAKAEKITTVTFQTPVSTYKRIKALAKKRKVPMKKLINEALSKVR